MFEVIEQIDNWYSAEEQVGLATVIKTWGSAPRKAGAKMAITPAGKIAGSVSGGCVEGAVFDEAVEALNAGQGRLLQYGVADETAWEVGLACGGNIKVFVEGLDQALFYKIKTLQDEDRIGGLATVVESPDPSLVGKQLLVNASERIHGWDHSEALELTFESIRNGKNELVTMADGSTLFIEVYLPAAQLIMVGGVHIAVALTNYAKVLGYKTIVVDPRRAFGSEERFPHVDQLIQEWPNKAFGKLTINENTAVALLTHDPKIDDPALDNVLRSSAFYIGALGSKKTHAKRVKRLTDKGYTDTEIGTIHGPIGLDINGQNPEEIALSIMAEIIKTRRG